jgi:hypothetical protein
MDSNFRFRASSDYAEVGGGAVETADGLVFLGIPPLETHFDFLVSPERARARLKKLSTTR